jgi:hypothetical protein
MKAINQLQLPGDMNRASGSDIKERLKALSHLLEIKDQEAATNNPDTVTHTDSFLSDISVELSRLAEIVERALQTVAYRQFKVKLDLSVAQLACLLRMLIESEFITNRNISALIRSVAMACETRRSEHLSPRSLRVKFYEIEDATLGTVRDMLSHLSKWPASNG